MDENLRICKIPLGYNVKSTQNLDLFAVTRNFRLPMSRGLSKVVTELALCLTPEGQTADRSNKIMYTWCEK